MGYIPNALRVCPVYVDCVYVVGLRNVDSASLAWRRGCRLILRSTYSTPIARSETTPVDVFGTVQ
jgi:hypothetical protein